MSKWDTLIAVNCVTSTSAYAKDVKGRIYFSGPAAEYDYKNYLWAVEKLEAADKGEVFNLPIGHEKFMDKVFDIWERSLDNLTGEVYFR